ncbi:MAG TPA: glycoside hydrolase family 18 protein [Dehalococcoidia bacterium]|nr:glycoside hydrolase family 18 protein [Dehalococcoidia bacterium]
MLASFRSRRARFAAVSSALLLAALAGSRATGQGTQTAAAASTSASVYHDALASGWSNWSWNASVGFNNSSPVYGGTKSIKLTVTKAWGALQLHSNGGASATQYPYLTFAAQASQPGQAFDVAITDTDNRQLGPFVPLSNYGSQPAPGAWTVYTIPVADLGGAGKQVGGVVLQEAQGKAQPAIYVDEIAFVNGAAPGASATPSPTASATPTGTPSATPSATASPSPSPTPSPTPSATPSPTPTGTPPPSSGRIVMGYFPIWVVNSGYTYQNVDFSALTHIAHFSVTPNADGTISIPDWGPFPDTNLLSAAKAAGVKVILVVGTGDDSTVTANFAKLASSATSRQAFATNLNALLDKYGYSGAELDWEFPANNTDKANLTALVSTLRTTLGNGKTLSISAPSNNWNGQWYDMAKLNQYLDWFSVMTYDMSGSGWSAQVDDNAALYAGHSGEENASADMAYYQSFGIPRSKILMGLPFFGQQFNAATAIYQTNNAPAAGSAPDYKDIAPLIGNGWTAYRGASSGVPYLVHNGAAGVISFDDATSIAAKCSFVKNNSLGGVMIWHLGKDALSGSQPLLQAAKSCR